MSTIAATRSAADAARLPLMLAELRLPTMKRMWADLADQSNREGWPAERFLGALLDHIAVARGVAYSDFSHFADEIGIRGLTEPSRELGVPFGRG